MSGYLKISMVKRDQPQIHYCCSLRRWRFCRVRLQRMVCSVWYRWSGLVTGNLFKVCACWPPDKWSVGWSLNRSYNWLTEFSGAICLATASILAVARYFTEHRILSLSWTQSGLLLLGCYYSYRSSPRKVPIILSFFCCFSLLIASDCWVDSELALWALPQRAPVALDLQLASFSYRP